MRVRKGLLLIIHWSPEHTSQRCAQSSFLTSTLHPFPERMDDLMDLSGSTNTKLVLEVRTVPPPFPFPTVNTRPEGRGVSCAAKGGGDGEGGEGDLGLWPPEPEAGSTAGSTAGAKVEPRPLERLEDEISSFLGISEGGEKVPRTSSLGTSPCSRSSRAVATSTTPWAISLPLRLRERSLRSRGRERERPSLRRLRERDRPREYSRPSSRMTAA